MKALALFILFTTTCFAQKAMPFKEATEEGIYPKVDSIYKSAFQIAKPFYKRK